MTHTILCATNMQRPIRQYILYLHTFGRTNCESIPQTSLAVFGLQRPVTFFDTCDFMEDIKVVGLLFSALYKVCFQVPGHLCSKCASASVIRQLI